MDFDDEHSIKFSNSLIKPGFVDDLFLAGKGCLKCVQTAIAYSEIKENRYRSNPSQSGRCGHARGVNSFCTYDFIIFYTALYPFYRLHSPTAHRKTTLLHCLALPYYLHCRRLPPCKLIFFEWVLCSKGLFPDNFHMG